MADPILRLSNIKRQFYQGGECLEILRGVDLTIDHGEMVAIVGASGAGKSTLLHVAGTLERPDHGVVEIMGGATHNLSDAKRSHYRNQYVGFVYQFHHLLPDFSALENVMMPLLIAGMPSVQVSKKAHDMLEQVGLSHRMTHTPAQLSGGEQQRVAIARALVHQPKLLLADEPTGNLDEITAESVFLLLQRLIKDQGIAALIATHDLSLAQKMNRVIRLEKGHCYAA
jgi:lipoprotein-releasing system ATP-binding protein